MKASFASRLRQEVSNSGGINRVVELSGIPKGSLYNMLSGTKSNVFHVAAVARACNVSIDWLCYGGAPEAAPRPPTGQISAAEVDWLRYRDAPETAPLPLIGQISAADAVPTGHPVASLTQAQRDNLLCYVIDNVLSPDADTDLRSFVLGYLEATRKG
ncbi:MAG TPA: hypothetical protein PLO69_11260 [Gammaproteobacteria bacterium]|nr:hypothetical protein [Gammaproteobacteria bacterium]